MKEKTYLKSAVTLRWKMCNKNIKTIKENKN